MSNLGAFSAVACCPMRDKPRAEKPVVCVAIVGPMPNTGRIESVLLNALVRSGATHQKLFKSSLDDCGSSVELRFGDAIVRTFRTNRASLYYRST